MQRRRAQRRLVLAICVAGATAMAGAAHADVLADWMESLPIPPLSWNVYGLELRTGGWADGAGFNTTQSGFDPSGFTGQVRASARLQYTSDDGTVFGARSVVLLYHDALSGDRYGNDVLEKTYVYSEFAYGRIELGDVDGAGYQLGLTGPKVEDQLSIDDPQTAFFKNPLSGKRFDNFFRLDSDVDSSANAAKLSFFSPSLFGVELAASFTPTATKDVIPFLANPTNAPDAQDNLWEIAASWNGHVSQLVMGLSAAFAQGRAHDAAAGVANLYDWALGTEAAYTLDDGTKLSLGGAYRQSNAYGFDISQVYRGGETHLAHLSATIENGSWIAGAEYSQGTSDAPGAAAHLRVGGEQLSAGYRITSHVQLTAGWQHFDWKRDSGNFYNGKASVAMNALYLNFRFSL